MLPAMSQYYEFVPVIVLTSCSSGVAVVAVMLIQDWSWHDQAFFERGSAHRGSAPAATPEDGSVGSVFFSKSWPVQSDQGGSRPLHRAQPDNVPSPSVGRGRLEVRVNETGRGGSRVIHWRRPRRIFFIFLSIITGYDPQIGARGHCRPRGSFFRNYYFWQKKVRYTVYVRVVWV